MLRGAMLVAAAVLVLPAAPITRQTSTRLTLHASVERAIEADARHAYEIALGEGDCATITVDQEGLDVVITTLDAAGATVSVIDEEMRRDGREQVTLLGNPAGMARFTIRARYPKHGSGKYAVWIDEIRPATDRDRALVEARRLRTEAENLRAAGKIDDAFDGLTRALDQAERAFGKEGALVGALSGDVGATERLKGKRADAERSLVRAIETLQAAVGRDDPRTAYYTQELALLYNAMDDFPRAESLLLDAAGIFERTLGDHPRLAACYMSLALIRLNRGDPQGSLKDLTRAYEIAGRTVTPDDITQIQITNNLGDLYLNIRAYDRARPFLEEALSSVERTLGHDNYLVANPLIDLAIIAREKGEFASALQLLQRAYDVRAKAYGAGNTQTALLLISIGNVNHAQGDYERALETYQRAYDALEKSAGPYHSLTMMAMANAARTFAAAGRADEALAYQARYDALVEKAIDFNLAAGSERERLNYLEGTFEKMGRTITLNLTELPQSAAAADLAASAILRRKGRVLDTIADNREALRARLDPADRELLDDYKAVTKKLSQLALSGPGRIAPTAYRTQLDDLEKDRGRIEANIAARSAQFRAETRPVSLEAVRAAIPADAALVEFAAYEPFRPAAKTDNDAHDAPRYAAYIIRPNADTTGVDLGTVKEIDAAAARLREALRDPAREDVSRLSRNLDRLVMQPVRARIGGAQQLLIAPDGALNLIPFGALVDERGRFQVQRYSISYLGSGRDVLRMQVARASTAPPVVIADPAFGEPPVTAHGPVYFSPLDATRAEGQAIARLLPGAVVLIGSHATKAALSQASAPSILHIASHAFFLPESGSRAAPAVEGTRSMTPTVQSSNPLLRSGIALAGANLSQPGDPGILTALEASTLNLWGTRLVTLSACDTGVGDVKTGEGVYGLRRAFFVAGAESLVMTLWPISDQVTRTVMTRYYAALARGEGRGAALRRVQLAMITDPQRRHPFYWASFIEAGDWKPIH